MGIIIDCKFFLLYERDKNVNNVSNKQQTKIKKETFSHCFQCRFHCEKDGM